MDNETREMLEAQGNRLTKLEVQTAPIPQTQADVKQLQADVADVKEDVAWIRGTLEERARNEVNAHNAKTRLGMWIFGGIATLSALTNLLQWLFSVRPSP